MVERHTSNAVDTCWWRLEQHYTLIVALFAQWTALLDMLHTNFTMQLETKAKPRTTWVSTKPEDPYMMASCIGCLVATLVYGCPQPGEVAGVGLGRVIAVCGVLLKIRFAAGDQVGATSLPVPALAT